MTISAKQKTRDICRDIICLRSEQVLRIHVSHELCNSEMGMGESSDKSKQLVQLREKFRHKASETHGVCQNIKCKAEENMLERAVT
jgi:hypothetical protein